MDLFDHGVKNRGEGVPLADRMRPERLVEVIGQEHVLGKGQQAVAFTFFKPAERQGSSVSGQPYRKGVTGAPVLESAPAFVECRLVTTVERGDHSLFVGEVVEAGVAKAPEGRADDATLWLKDLGEKVFYGG